MPAFLIVFLLLLLVVYAGFRSRPPEIGASPVEVMTLHAMLSFLCCSVAEVVSDKLKSLRRLRRLRLRSLIVVRLLGLWSFAAAVAILLLSLLGIT